MQPSDARPLIAVTTSEVRRSETVTPTPEGEPPQREMALGMRYLEALEAAGAIPIVTPPLSGELARSLLTRVDGVCLSGGPDLDPEAYGERRHERTGPVDQIWTRSSWRWRAPPTRTSCRSLRSAAACRS